MHANIYYGQYVEIYTEVNVVIIVNDLHNRCYWKSYQPLVIVDIRVIVWT